MGTDTVLIDREAIDVRYLEQLSENGQTTALAHMMSWILDNVKAEEDSAYNRKNVYNHRKTRNGSNYTSQLLRRSSCFTKKAGVICVS